MRLPQGDTYSASVRIEFGTRAIELYLPASEGSANPQETCEKASTKMFDSVMGQMGDVEPGKTIKAPDEGALALRDTSVWKSDPLWNRMYARRLGDHRRESGYDARGTWFFRRAAGQRRTQVFKGSAVR